MLMALFISETIFAAGGTWKHNKNGYWYEYSDGTYVTNDWLQDGSKWYYFNASGEMLANQYVYSCYVGADGAMTTPPAEKVSDSEERDYVLNTNTLKIHLPSCTSVTEMNPRNKQGYHGTIADLKNKGYSRCNRCLSEY